MPTQAEQSIDAFNQYYSRPPEISTKKSILQFIYNSKEKTVLGRNATNWSKCHMLWKIK